MKEAKLWMVRAGRGAKHIDDFFEGNYVGIGWTDVGDINAGTPKVEIEKRLADSRPSASKATIAVWAAQIKRFHKEFEVGHEAMTYDPGQRLYFLGPITGDVRFTEHDLGIQRSVKWIKKVARDSLTVATRNSIGSISTLFLVPPPAAKEIRSKAVGLDAEFDPEPPESTELDDKDVLDEVVSKAEEFIEDRIAALDWEQMQDLVAGILEAIGYQTRTSPKGADRGVDIFASPDGLGLEEPRIFVEVKHRPGTSIGSQQVRAFLGGRQPGDRCLYVSTGGFTKDARYEAERSSVPVTLLTLPELRELLVDNYAELATSVAAMVPLEKIYWPTA